MSIPKVVTVFSIALACLVLPGCQQPSSQTPDARSAQSQSDEERQAEKFSEEVERKKHTTHANPGNESKTWGKQVP